jgi:hypothetical protein
MPAHTIILRFSARPVAERGKVVAIDARPDLMAVVFLVGCHPLRVSGSRVRSLGPLSDDLSRVLVVAEPGESAAGGSCF